jgi:hypothetical protein
MALIILQRRCQRIRGVHSRLGAGVYVYVYVDVDVDVDASLPMSGFPRRAGFAIVRYNYSQRDLKHG